MSYSTVRISEELKEEVNQFNGSNFEERLKKWAGLTEPTLTEKRVKDLALEVFEEEIRKGRR